MKRTWIAVALIGFLLVTGSIWLGGNGRWELQGVSMRDDVTEEDLTRLSDSLKNHTDPVSSKYNLAAINYKQQKYEDAKETLTELLNSNQADRKVTRKILYNLGNVYYRLSEKSESLTTSIELLSQSLAYYRAVIEDEKQENKYSSADLKQDVDAHDNYVLVRRKLKILQDELKKEHEKQQAQKQLFQLLTELKEREEEISNQLKGMQQDPLSKQTVEKRSELLKIRQENIAKLQIIKQKILQNITTPKQSSPASTI